MSMKNLRPFFRTEIKVLKLLDNLDENKDGKNDTDKSIKSDHCTNDGEEDTNDWDLHEKTDNNTTDNINENVNDESDDEGCDILCFKCLREKCF